MTICMCTNVCAYLCECVGLCVYMYAPICVYGDQVSLCMYVCVCMSALCPCVCTYL